MKNISRFYIFATVFYITLSSNLLAQNEKEPVATDVEKQDAKIINNDDKEDVKEEVKVRGKFYLGVDASLQKSRLGGRLKNPNDFYEPLTSAMFVFAGYDNKDFFKIEGLYSKSNERKEIVSANNLSSFELRTRTLGVDFKPYLNFDKESQGLLYLIFGLNYNRIDAIEINHTKNSGSLAEKFTKNDSNVNKIVPAFGFGVEYLFYRNFVLRFQYKRNFVDAKIANSEVLNKVKIIDTLSAGISHAF
jgi:opacity protein-like surface antigen